MSKILLFARDPGAANCVIPVYNRLKERDFGVELYGKDSALKKYMEAGLQGKEIDKPLGEFLEGGKYGLMVTGMGSEDFTERLLWKEAKRLGIKTIAIIDQWLNYEARFTFDKPGCYSPDSPKIFPDLICTIDQYAKEEMVSKGLPGDKIVVTGQPYFETVIKRHEEINEEKKIEIRKNLGVKENDLLITFASEPIVESYADPMHWGYTEFTILESIINVLKRTKKPGTLVIRLHPRNKRELFENLDFPQDIKVILEDKITSQELIAVSDLVLGMSSMFILEAALVGVPYASVQIGLNREDPFVLSRRGISKTILSEDELMLLLESSAQGKGTEGRAQFEVVKDASSRIVKEIEKLL